jgi:hypothetical protein
MAYAISDAFEFAMRLRAVMAGLVPAIHAFTEWFDQHRICFSPESRHRQARP